MRALVTGGAGFIGSHIVDALVRDGASVTVLDSLDPRVHSEAPRLPPGVVVERGDVRDSQAVTHALRTRPDVVFHEAAMVGVGRGAVDAADYIDVNVQGTIQLFRHLANDPPERVVLASTMALYGEGAYHCPSCAIERTVRRAPTDLDAGAWEPCCPSCKGPVAPRPVHEEHTPAPGTAYAISKLAQESIAFSLGREMGIPVVALRYHNVYGARMPRRTPYAGVASHFRSRLEDGRPPILHEDGGQLRDFVRVEDIARANILAAGAPLDRVAFEAMNIGTGEARPIRDIADALCRAIRPDLVPEESGSYRVGDARHVYASIEKARRLLGYAPEWTLEEGLARFAKDPLRAPPEGPLA